MVKSPDRISVGDAATERYEDVPLNKAVLGTVVLLTVRTFIASNVTPALGLVTVNAPSPVVSIHRPW